MNDLADLFKLSAAERIQLAEDLWDSVAADPNALPPFSEAQQAEIRRRVSEHLRNPSSAKSSDAVRAKLWSKIG
ncbi:MAG: addiction module protein [Proteobacteria bacterium]|nr:addiction module protein [Pseudomonadota bacterium]